MRAKTNNSNSNNIIRENTNKTVHFQNLNFLFFVFLVMVLVVVLYISW